MPELPEVETTRLGIQAHLLHQTIQSIVIRDKRLRWPVDTNIANIFQNKTINKVGRRGKYIIISCDNLHLLIHLGMSGSLRVIKAQKLYSETTLVLKPEKHDHFDIVLTNGTILRYKDPRRFGALLHFCGEINKHKLLVSLGPEPLSSDFKLIDFYKNSRKRKVTIKQYIMDAHEVVGIGNIYANESLYLAGIRPGIAACRVSYQSFSLLHQAIINVLGNAIAKGGTTLKDFIAPSVENNNNQAGYFQQELFVYNRSGDECKICGKTIKTLKIAQRSSFYCPECQK
jgi:formamidopyrimidine-DNA glycosylase